MAVLHLLLQWWEARFERITLEDRNLPEIAARRLLRPRSEAARRQIDDAYAQTEKVRREVFETLLTPRADTAAFRKVYPFAAAEVQISETETPLHRLETV